MAQARLALADGSIFHGRSVGAVGTVTGEAVFNTGMAGYEEVLSDPSYSGQIVTMTYPEVGNYGMNAADMESDNAKVAGFVMRQCCDNPSNFRSDESLSAFLTRTGVVAIDGIDTRAITRRLRVDGAMNSALTSDDTISDEDLIATAQNVVSMEGQDLATAAGTVDAYDWNEAADPTAFNIPITWDLLEGEPLVVCIDLGIKYNILRLLRACGMRLRVVPASTSAEDILAMKPAGVFLSNGPGDPAAVQGIQETVQALVEASLPIFGICLGHQILSLALGATTYKLKFGHRGVNHPIKRLSDGVVEIASHNHGFAVDPKSLPAGVEMTHLNLNDQTCAGIACVDKPIFSVQYHPEAGPGPADPLYLFEQFTENIRTYIKS